MLKPKYFAAILQRQYVFISEQSLRFPVQFHLVYADLTALFISEDSIEEVLLKEMAT